MATEVTSVKEGAVDVPPGSDFLTKRTAKEEEGVEVVLDDHQKTSVVEQAAAAAADRPKPDQNVFRPPQAVRPRAVRAANGGPPVKGSGSYGGYPPPPHSAAGPATDYGRPYPVPYNPSGSFDHGEVVAGGAGVNGQHYPPPHTSHSHYSPHVQYPPPGGRRPEDVNVISPNHKTGDHRLPPVTSSRGAGYRAGHPGYQYPPTSPVSRGGGAHANSPPRMRQYRRPDAAYSTAGQHHPQQQGSWGYASPDRRPPVVAESSFDSEHYNSSHASHPNTPNAPHYGPPGAGAGAPDSHYGAGFYGAGSFGGSFDSHHGPQRPPHFDDHRYYGHRSAQYPPESPYSPYAAYGHPPHHPGYSPSGGYYDHYSPHDPHGHYRSYDETEGPNAITPSKKKGDNGMILPKAAQEVDFDISEPPAEPITEPSKSPMCDSPADVNSFDVLCGRGGGTNSQVGNRRFRKLVQEFQPTYLLARRKEKPLLARTIVLIIRKRGGRFLKKDDETGELYEVGDIKAEAKTSQALREGLDVRATKSATSSKKKKNKQSSSSVKTEDETKEESIVSPAESHKSSKSSSSSPKNPQSPPTLPRLAGEEKPMAISRPPSPENLQFRKRRRMRSGDAADPTPNNGGCGAMGFQDKLFPDFCPPRADLARAASPTQGIGSPMQLSHQHTPIRNNSRMYDEDDDDDIRYEAEAADRASRGCAGIAFDMVTGAASGSFCLGPRKWK